MTLRPIGYLSSCFAAKFGTPRQGILAPSSRAEVILDRQVCPDGILEGLEGFSHVWLISHFHQSNTDFQQGKIHPPRLRGRKIGVFASRSPHRPNPLALTVAKIEQIQDNRLILSHIDLIDGTPILDIKPYIPQVDAIEASVPEWFENAEEIPRHPVSWTKEAQTQLQIRLEHSNHRAEEIIALVEEMLRFDPRPRVYQKQPERPHVFTVYEWDVRFRWQADHFEVYAFESV